MKYIILSSDDIHHCDILASSTGKVSRHLKYNNFAWCREKKLRKCNNNTTYELGTYLHKKDTGKKYKRWKSNGVPFMMIIIIQQPTDDIFIFFYLISVSCLKMQQQTEIHNYHHALSNAQMLSW